MAGKGRSVMHSLNPLFICWKCGFMHSLNPWFLLLLLQNCSTFAVMAAAGSKVEFLPGFDGPLPFHLETGYIGVGEREDVQFFYYFIKSESNYPTAEDPLVLWLSGGPGCSSFIGLIYEIGPIAFEAAKYMPPESESNTNGDAIPKLILNPNSWTKVANIIFLDIPVGTGFSYAKNSQALETTDLQTYAQVNDFLRKFLINHPEFIQNPFYIGGDSYAGLYVPVITQYVLDGNGKEMKPIINLKGYLIGNGVTSPNDNNYMVPFAQGMGLIPDELYEDDEYNYSAIWAGKASVQEALHVRKGTIKQWVHCNKALPFTVTVKDVVSYHANLSRRGMRSLIYSGDHDMVVPFIATQAWIRSLKYSIVAEWHPWMVEGQVAGYTRTYSNQMTFATVKGAGHTAPEYKPIECKYMFQRWISYQSL